ncbi:MAG: AcrB/AcrD/AcrF family protein [Epsilonproteobacteria bacterium]|nr:MAG: AcrB/AcrD/AcrF family protein [Campylobacterota bacterium]
MKNILRFFAKNLTLANLNMILLMIMGIFSYYTINRDINPKVDFGRMEVTTYFPGASPEDVEINVTNKIERELLTVTGIKKFHSISKENQSYIQIWIDPDISNQEKVKSDIRRAVDGVNDLPVEIEKKPYVHEENSGMFPIIEVGLYGDVPYRELRELAKGFEKKLKRIKGVSRLNSFGMRDREIKIEVDPDKIKKYYVPLEHIVKAIRTRNVRSSGGHFASYMDKKSVVTLSQFKRPLEVKEVLVKANLEGFDLRVKNLANVKDGFKEEKIRSRMNGKPAISFVVQKGENADIVDTVDRIRELVAEEEKYLPANVKFTFSDDLSRTVKNRFNIVKSNGIMGLILVVIVLSFFLNFRSSFWVAMGIPITILGVVFLLKVFGHSLDAIGMTAVIVVIGIIVDDAIIISENIYRHFEELGKSPLDAAVDGLMEVAAPVLTTILTTLVAFAPMFFMKGLMGKFMFVIPMVITFALVISLVEAFLILPAHLVHGLRNTNGKTQSEISFKKYRKKFSEFLTKILKYRYRAIGVFLAVFITTMFFAYKYMDIILFPTTTANRIFIVIDHPTGTSLEANSDKVKEIEEIVQGMSKRDIDSYVTRIGLHTAQRSKYTSGENFASVELNLVPYGERIHSVEEIIAELRKKTGKLLGYEKIIYRVAEGGPPTGKPIAIRVIGSDDKSRNRLADDIEKTLNVIPGVVDLSRDDKMGKKQIQIILDHYRVSQYGLNVSQIADTIRMAYDGLVVTDVRYEDEDVDFRVLLEEGARAKEGYLNNLLVTNERGKLIPLGKVAKFEEGIGTKEIKHFDGERALSITGDVNKSITTPLKVMSLIEKKFKGNRDYPGVRLYIGGEAEETSESLKSLGVTFIISGVAIYFLLIMLFNSFTQPLYVLVAIPFGLVGVVISFALHGEPLGFLAILGVVGLAGIVVNDSLVLVNHLNKLRLEKPDKNILEIISQGSADRLRAILITTVTTVIGLLPLAYGMGGSDPFMIPMALALGYGLLFSTILVLILVPCIYMVGEDFKIKFINLRLR